MGRYDLLPVLVCTARSERSASGSNRYITNGLALISLNLWIEYLTWLRRKTNTEYWRRRMCLLLVRRKANTEYWRRRMCLLLVHKQHIRFGTGDFGTQELKVNEYRFFFYVALFSIYLQFSWIWEWLSSYGILIIIIIVIMIIILILR